MGAWGDHGGSVRWDEDEPPTRSWREVSWLAGWWFCESMVRGGLTFAYSPVHGIGGWGWTQAEAVADATRQWEHEHAILHA